MKTKGDRCGKCKRTLVRAGKPIPIDPCRCAPWPKQPRLPKRAPQPSMPRMTAEERKQHDVAIVRAFLARCGDAPQLTSTLARDTQLDRGRALACLRQLETEGVATRLIEGWVLVAHKNGRLSEVEEQVLYRYAYMRGTAEGLISWINHNWPVKREELLDVIDRLFPPVSRRAPETGDELDLALEQMLGRST